MATVTIYHNPRCSKSRQALQLLQQHGMEPTVIEYLKTPLDAVAIDRLLKKMNLEPQAVIRSREHRALGLPDAKDRSDWIARMAAHPEIIERPIVVVGRQAVLGRPPEKVLEIL